MPQLAVNKQDRRTDFPGTAPPKPGLDSATGTELRIQDLPASPEETYLPAR